MSSIILITFQHVLMGTVLLPIFLELATIEKHFRKLQPLSII